jgi:selenocysteine-specific elongation factor
VRVRGIESLKERAAAVSGVARVAVNLRGAAAPARGMALVEPGRWALASVADVRLVAAGHPPRQLTVHIGAARTVARVRVLGGRIARLTLHDALPLHVGDRLLLRDPGAAAGAGQTAGAGQAEAWPPLAGATVLDLAPPALARRGAAAAAAAELAGWPPVPGAAELIRRHRLIQAGTLRAMGVTGLPAPVSGDWLADPAHWAGLRGRLATAVGAHLVAAPLSAGLPVEAARAQLGLPARQLAEALAGPALVLRGGSLRPAGAGPELPDRVQAAVAALRGELARQPFAAPEAARLRELGLDTKAVAAAARAGLLLRIAEQVVLAPGADQEAARILAQLPQPFTAAQARQVLGTTRRVAIPLLEYLDRSGATRRLPDDRRVLTSQA